MKHASEADCPCCSAVKEVQEKPDHAMVTAFLSGIFIRHGNVPISRALCAKHSLIAADAMHYVTTGTRLG